MKKETGADTLYSAFKDNFEEIIAWARAEIKEYKKLIKLLEGKNK